MSVSSNVSVKHVISSESNQPSLSSSVSFSSGIPSPSVSNSDEVIISSNESEYTELLAQIVYKEALNVVIDMPEIIPLLGLSIMLVGKSGLDSQLVIAPPEVTGTSGMKLSFTVIFRLFVKYEITMIESSDSSSKSQIPSLSMSEGTSV